MNRKDFGQYLALVEEKIDNETYHAVSDLLQEFTSGSISAALFMAEFVDTIGGNEQLILVLNAYLPSGHSFEFGFDFSGARLALIHTPEGVIQHEFIPVALEAYEQPESTVESNIYTRDGPIEHPFLETSGNTPRAFKQPSSTGDTPTASEQHERTATSTIPPASKNPEAWKTHAAEYLDRVHEEYKDDPAIYYLFLDTMFDFLHDKINPSMALNRLVTLFEGRSHLILGFNVFLPGTLRIHTRTQASRDIGNLANSTTRSMPVDNTDHETQFIEQVRSRLESRNQLQRFVAFLLILKAYEEEDTEDAFDRMMQLVGELFKDDQDLLDIFRKYGRMRN